jgi:hypothetical protein
MSNTAPPPVDSSESADPPQEQLDEPLSADASSQSSCDFDQHSDRSDLGTKNIGDTLVPFGPQDLLEAMARPASHNSGVVRVTGLHSLLGRRRT